MPDITAIWEMNKSETKYPLKWEKIESAEFQKYKYHNQSVVNESIVNSLKKLSAGRTDKGEYAELRKKIADYRAKLKNKSISLKEESDKNRQQEKEMEEKIKNGREKEGIDLKNDLFLREAINVGCDYYDIISK